jgi:hypothetical protein
MFADVFQAKTWATQTPEDEATFMPPIRKLWQQLWVGG